jgi:hypothetical protein
MPPRKKVPRRNQAVAFRYGQITDKTLTLIILSPGDDLASGTFLEIIPGQLGKLIQFWFLYRHWFTSSLIGCFQGKKRWIKLV